MSKNLSRRWTKEEERVLSKIILRHIKEGQTLDKAFDFASFRLERGIPAVRSRWFTHLKEYHEADYNFAKKRSKEGVLDTRYNEPKTPPKANREQAKKAIDENKIYSSVRDAFYDAQKKYAEYYGAEYPEGEVKEEFDKAQETQVAYGLDKYPETLNADTWTVIETIDHIIGETVDKLHYLNMLKTKLIKIEEEKTS